jgi:predicted nucleotidyltransferase
MRLSKEYKKTLLDTIHSIIPDAEVYLFGSRTREYRKGGDIDILILAKRKLSILEKMEIKRKFYNQHGEQKIDIVSDTFQGYSLFVKAIKDEAVRL